MSVDDSYDAPIIPPAPPPKPVRKIADVTPAAGPAAGPVKDNVVDKRVRIQAYPGKENEIYGSSSSTTNPMRVFHSSNGLIFPYTPTIDYQQNPVWSSQELTHFIQQYYYFTAIESAQITVTGKFTAQNEREAAYTMAAFHFLRSYSKMHFGESDPKRGLPPPVLILNGYGDFMFNDLPVIIRNWKFDFPDNVDYVKVITKPTGPTPITTSLANSVQSPYNTNVLGSVSPSFTGYAYVPAVTTISITMTVQQPPTKLKKTFNLQDFREGKLLGSTKGFT